MSNITVIIPVHEVQNNMEALLKRAVDSVANQKTKPSELLIVRSKDEELKTFLDSFDFGDIKDITRVIENDGDTSFQGQMNYGISEIKTPYFTFLEYDDELSAIWLNAGEEYITHYPEVGVFLPIVFEANPEGQFLSFTNEAVWAKDFSEEMGYIDNNVLQNFGNFNFDGMIVKKEVIDEFGGIKTNMELTFTYEFLLRMTYNSVPVMVIPKLGYKHTNSREGSLFVDYKQRFGVMESRFWQNQAKKEYFWSEDREITYEREEA
jgi:glycosyltransferase involved in cell wall biosynthesis